jgi:hypothetical protein
MPIASCGAPAGGGPGYDYEQLVSDPAGLAAANGLSSDAMAQATGALEQHIAEECGS